jgi:hypothetical protein
MKPGKVQRAVLLTAVLLLGYHPFTQAQTAATAPVGDRSTLNPPPADIKSGSSIMTPIARVSNSEIAEMSGLVKSRRFPDVYWVHNDSGDSPRLFAIDRQGNVIITNYLRNQYYGEHEEPGKELWQGFPIQLAANNDWEDIALDGDFLYIADLGNNENARRDMGVYVLYEPNPRAVRQSRILKFLPIKYPEQNNYPANEWHFDSESLFVAEGKLYFLTKHRQAGKPMQWQRGVNLYRLETSYTDRANILKKIDSNDSITLATGADISPDGTKLAILSYTALWVFDKPRFGNKWVSGRPRMMALDPKVTRQIEAVCWDDDETLLISNEQRDIFEVKLTQFQRLEN